MIKENKPEFERPESFVTSGDKVVIWVVLLLALTCTVGILNPFSYFSKFFNTALLQAIPLNVALVLFVIPIFMYYSIETMEKCYFRELLLQKGRRRELFKKKQKVTITARYREFNDDTKWELSNRSLFGWTNAKFLIERVHQGKMETEKHDLRDVPMMQRVSIVSKLTCFPGAKWRVMVLAEEGHCIEYPERQEVTEYQA
ncbi:MAG: hypothetical protein ACI9S8_001518 [Chlamydiales bacterium]|jgi:hypothetical protein